MVVMQNEEVSIARIAAAIGEPARTRILYSLLDGHAKTSTELATIADVSPSTTSVHLQRLMTQGLIKVLNQGKHRYYSLTGANVARALEALSMVAGSSVKKFVPNTPGELRFARTCYDHIAGQVGVRLHHRFRELGWVIDKSGTREEYKVSDAGSIGFESAGIDIHAARSLRRRFAYPCVDWSERQPHIGGSLGSALLHAASIRKWLIRDLSSRALELTRYGKREILTLFGVDFTTPINEFLQRT
jgi:DNA-binding transcriptional ArsR family regulator